MKWLVVEALFYLVRTDLLMHRRGVASLHKSMTELSTSKTAIPGHTLEQVCRAADIASVLYFKRVLCLQRSAATTMLLRRYGFAVDLVIGARIVPFKSHAWVEIQGLVVNDKPYMQDIYEVMERC